MSEENEQTKQEEGQETTEKQEEEEKISLPALKKAEEVLKKLEDKEKKLEERESALDKKIKEFDAMAASVKVAGFGVMQQEPTEEQKKDDAARALLKGTGFEEMAFPSKK